METTLCKLSAVDKIIKPSNNDLVSDIVKYVDENFHYDISLQDIAERADFCSTYMSEQFKKRTGKNFREYITNLRVEKAKILLSKPDLKIADISDLIGYNNSSYFIRVFKRITTKTPNEFRIISNSRTEQEERAE